MATASTINRVFKIGQTRVEDPDPSMTSEQVQEHLSTQYPELTSGSFTGPDLKNGEHVFTFQRKVGTKG